MKKIILLLLFLPLVVFPQIPSGGSTGVSLTTTYTVPSGLDPATLTNGNTYDMYVLNQAGDAIIGTNADFVYDNGAGNVLPAIGGLTNNTVYQWGVWADGDDPLLNSAAYGPFLFTTLIANPVLTYPTNGATFVPLVPNVTWTFAGGTTGVTFDVELSTNGGSSWSNVVTGLSGTSTNYTFSIPLSSYTNYVLRVRAKKAGESDKTSSENSFTTIIAAPLLTAPVNGFTGVSVLPTLDWDAVSGADTYKLYVDNNSDCSSPFFVQDVGAGTIYTFDATISGFPLTQGATYYWKVAGVTTADGEGPSSSIYHFTVTPGVTPVLSTPNGVTVYSSPVTFGWYTSTSTSGLKFVVQYYYGSAPTTESDWSGATSLAATTSLTTTGTVLYGKTYYWRVLVQRTSNDEYVYYPTPTTYGTFTTAGGTSVTCYPSWPVGGATVYTNSPTLYWYLDQYQSGLKFQVNYSKNSAVDGNGMLNNANTKSPEDADIVAQGSSNLYKTLSSLDAGSTYNWQVRAYYNGGWSAWSSVASFVTNGPGTVVVPVPSFPTGGVTVYTTSPTIYWYLPTAASGLYYEIEYDLQANALTGTADVTTTTPDVLYLQLTGLTPGASYHYKIRSKDAAGLNAGNHSAWSDEGTFVVAGGTTASYAVASWPLGTTVYTNHPTLFWYLEGSSLGISGFEVKYKKDSAPANWVTFSPGAPDATDGEYSVSSSTFSKTIAADLTYGATYYWAVYATGTSHPINPLGVGSFTVVGGQGSATVELSFPDDGSTISSTTPTLYWYVAGPTQGINNFTVKVSQSDMFAVYDEYTVASTILQKTLPTLTNGATYYWKVGANYTSGTVWSDEWSFTVSTGSPAIVQPIVGSPVNVTVNTSSPMLSWALPAKPAANSSFEVQLADNPSFQKARLIASNNQNVNVDGLSSGKSYFWRVRSKDNSGFTSTYSNVAQFRINTVTSVNDNDKLPTHFDLAQNYPNPFNPTTSITYSIPSNSFVTLKIYDMLGREVKTLVNKEVSAGTHSVEWNGTDNFGVKIASGTYFYRISAGNFTSVKKMVLLK